MSKAFFHHILTKKEFQSNGKLEKLWFKAGNIKTLPNGRIYMTLFNQPNTDFYVFEPNEKEDELPVVS